MQQVKNLLAQDGLAENYLCLVLGDFNCTPDSEPATVLLGNGWKTAVDDENAVGTFHGFTGEPGNRIDMIMIPDRCEATEAEVITVGGGENGIWPSDHFPVRAIVTLKPASE